MNVLSFIWPLKRNTRKWKALMGAGGTAGLTMRLDTGSHPGLVPC